MILQTVLDGLRARKQRFLFEGDEIQLQPSVMAFITMNPGYPGRAELPESLKVYPFTSAKNFVQPHNHLCTFAEASMQKEQLFDATAVQKM